MNSRHRLAGRRGFSLLEVLVACGILVIGLASIAAILPAASSRLAEATATDRAAALATVAMSEIQSRGLVARELFTGVPAGTAVVFGQSLPNAVTGTSRRFNLSNSTSVLVQGTANMLVTGSAVGNAVSTLPGLSGTGTLLTGTGSGVRAARIASANPAFLQATVTNRMFLQEDTVLYGGTATGATPRNTFVPASSGSAAARAITPGLCWGAMVAPEPWGTPGTDALAASVSVAIFRKPGPAVLMTLSDTNGTGIFTAVGVPGSVQRTCLKSCSVVLAVPPPPATVRPQWLKIRTSWISGSNVLQTSSTITSGTLRFTDTVSVIFETDPLPANLTYLDRATRSICVVGFENLLLVEEKILTIR